MYVVRVLRLRLIVHLQKDASFDSLLSLAGLGHLEKGWIFRGTTRRLLYRANRLFYLGWNKWCRFTAVWLTTRHCPDLESCMHLWNSMVLLPHVWLNLKLLTGRGNFLPSSRSAMHHLNILFLWRFPNAGGIKLKRKSVWPPIFWAPIFPIYFGTIFFPRKDMDGTVLTDGGWCRHLRIYNPAHLPPSSL